MRFFYYFGSLIILTTLIALACDDSNQRDGADSVSDSSVDGDADSDTDTDADADADADSDADADTDTDADGDSTSSSNCPTDPNLATHGKWIGCDADTHDDDPYGIQGGWYVYSDSGGTCPSTVAECDATGCRFSGTTKDSGDYDTDWGCGLGLGLLTEPKTDTTPEMKLPYAGDATCFEVVIEGSSGGNEVRIGFTQFEENTGKVSPFMTLGEVDNGWSGSVCFDIIECPNWDGVNCEKTGNNYDMQFQVAGGDHAGSFDLKVTTLIPNNDIGTTQSNGDCPAMQSNGSSCKQYQEASVRADGKEYYVVSNAWGPGSADGTQCIDWNGTNFKITTQTASNDGAQPVSYPAAILGTKGTITTSDSGLPKQVSAITSIPTGFHTNASQISGTFNAAYDIWTNSSPNGTTAEYFLMLWLENKGNKQPAGSATDNTSIEGYQWQVWTGGTGEGGGKYIAYYLQGGKDAIDVDLKPFFDDAVQNRGLPSSQYVINIQAGFEIWSGGSGLESECFWADVK